MKWNNNKIMNLKESPVITHVCWEELGQKKNDISCQAAEGNV